MRYSLDQFSEECRASLQADAGERGQEQVRRHLEKLLAEPEALGAALRRQPEAGRHLLYRDAETRMHVFAHVYAKAGASSAHDHGPCWIIYGNATGYTDITDWKRLDNGERDGHAELEKLRQYRVHAGEAVLFRKGAIHSTFHPEGDSMLVRVISDDMDAMWRMSFDPEKKTVTARPPRQRSSSP